MSESNNTASAPIKTDSTIHNVADTALWIAGYRAQETARTDAAFHDTLAAQLAGDRGLAMAREFDPDGAMSFAMIIRTVAIDRLVAMAVERGVDTVINLGAGLDTRPYRLELPQSLRWIEIDFPAMIEYKNSKLAAETPRCSLERMSCDLTDLNARRALFQRLSGANRSACIITEGLIAYLSPEEAHSLSEDIFATRGFDHWIMDYSRGSLRKAPSRKIRAVLKSTPPRFTVSEPFPFFTSDGWRVEEDLHIVDEADRIRRKLPLMQPFRTIARFFPRTIRRLGNNTYGYVMFGR